MCCCHVNGPAHTAADFLLSLILLSAILFAVQEEEGVGLLMNHIADNTVICGNATLLIILLHNFRLVLTGRCSVMKEAHGRCSVASPQCHHTNVWSSSNRKIDVHL